MNSIQDISWLHGRCISYTELNYGRPSGLNPVLTQTITVVQQFDPIVGDFRPIAIPVTQILDPFGEVSFHSNQVNGIISALPLTLPQFPQIQANLPSNSATYLKIFCLKISRGSWLTFFLLTHVVCGVLK